MNELDNRPSDMARAAWLYYTEELTQSEIAKKLSVSRSTVIRLLQRAKESGIVQISIGVSSTTFEYERDLEKKFNLAKVRIVPEALDGLMQRRWLGQAGAEILAELAQDGSTMAVSWGSTLQCLADSMTGDIKRQGMKIVALNGGLHNASRGTNPHEVAEHLGQVFGASTRALYAPVYVRNETTASGLYNDPGLIEALDMARKSDLVVYSLGTIAPEATIIKLGYINAEEREFLVRRGAVGEIAGRWVDKNGLPIKLPETINPIGIRLDELQRIPNRLTVAGGREKTQAIRAILNGRLTTHLVTDEYTAQVLLS